MDVRTRILDAALAALARGDELTQPRVARAAGVRQSHLTYYFPTITDLLQAVARHSIEALSSDLARVRRSRRSAPLAAAIARGAADKARVRVMLALVRAADRDPSLRPRMRAFVRELRGRVGGMLAEGAVTVSDEDLAFVHTVVVGTAVLQLARDSAEARAEARHVLERALAAVSWQGRKRS